jgi:hypothetical protein
VVVGGDCIDDADLLRWLDGGGSRRRVLAPATLGRSCVGSPSAALNAFAITFDGHTTPVPSTAAGPVSPTIELIGHPDRSRRLRGRSSGLPRLLREEHITWRSTVGGDLHNRWSAQR